MKKVRKPKIEREKKIKIKKEKPLPQPQQVRMYIYINDGKTNPSRFTLYFGFE
jgi:hypothetical protein